MKPVDPSTAFVEGPSAFDDHEAAWAPFLGLAAHAVGIHMQHSLTELHAFSALSADKRCAAADLGDEGCALCWPRTPGGLPGGFQSLGHLSRASTSRYVRCGLPACEDRHAFCNAWGCACLVFWSRHRSCAQSVPALSSVLGWRFWHPAICQSTWSGDQGDLDHAWCSRQFPRTASLHLR